MSKRISQAHYDEVVLENMQTFDMTAEEAILDANEQFKAQDINLVEIVSDVALYTIDGILPHPVVEALSLIKSQSKHDGNHGDAVNQEPDNDFVVSCNNVIEQCKKGVNIRCLAGNADALPILMNHFKRKCHTLISLQALIAVSTGNPDILTKQGVLELMALLREDRRPTIQASALQLVHTTCKMQESNRVMFVDHGIIDLLLVSSSVSPSVDDGSLDATDGDGGILTLSTEQPDVYAEVCQVLIALTLDDDIRVPFGKGSQNVVTIVGNGKIFTKLSDMCKKYCDDHTTLSVIYRTMACLATKNEYCSHVMKSGGLNHLLNTMKIHQSNIHLMKNCLLLLKVVAGNDDVKLAIADCGLLHSIVKTMSRFSVEPSIVKNGCAAVAACVLRQASNCDQIMQQTEFPNVVTTALCIHAKKPKVLIQCCTAIRNLVSRSEVHRSAFLALSSETLLRQTATSCSSSSSTLAETATAALRDLGCQVKLNEKWQGKGHNIDQ